MVSLKVVSLKITSSMEVVALNPPGGRKEVGKGESLLKNTHVHTYIHTEEHTC